MNQKTKIVNLLILFIVFSSCEGFKILTIQNSSNSNAKVTVKPSLEEFEVNKLSNYPSRQFYDSSYVILEPDSSLLILSVFTTLMFGTKIKEHDLRTNYLRIETLNDTIVANSKQEILDLMYNRKQKDLPISSKGRNINVITIER